jgi:hypothetical protein
VFAWTQCRVHLPAWYGLGSAIQQWAGDDDARWQELRELVDASPLLQTILVADTGSSGPFPRYSRTNITALNNQDEIVAVGENEDLPGFRPVDRCRPKSAWRIPPCATAFGATASLMFDAKPAKGDDDNTIRLPEGLDPLEAEILRDCFRSFCAQGACGKGEIAGLQLEVTSLEGTVRPVPPPLLAKTFSDALSLGLNSSKFDVFEPIMNLEIIVPEEFCGGVLSDLSARGGVVRKVDADGRNSIIFLEIPLENVFGYATLLRSLSKGLGVFVLTYLKHGVRKRG